MRKGSEKKVIKIFEFLKLPVYLFIAVLILYFFLLKAELLFNSSPFFPPFSTILPILGLIFLVWGFFRIKKYYLSVLIEKAQLGKIGVHLSQIDTLNKIVTALVFFIALIFMVKALGYDASVLLTIGGIGGAFVGFATKDFIANFFGGFVIYLTQPFTVGDTIKLHERSVEGQVEAIGWYLTRIIDAEKQPVHIPNSMFSQVILITPSKRSHHRIKEVVSISPQDMDKIPAIIEKLKKVLLELPEIDHKEKIEIYFFGIERYQLNIEILAYTKEIKAHQYKKVIQSVLFKARECIVREGAHIPLEVTGVEILSPLEVNVNLKT